MNEHMVERKPNQLALALNQRTDADQKSLWAALEMFANCGDQVSDLQAFRQQHPRFFPVMFYDHGELLLKAGKDNFFNWRKRLLRSVWEGRDPEGKRLAVLLGTEEASYYGFKGGDFKAEEAEFVAISSDALRLGETLTEGDITYASDRLFPARVNPDWQAGSFRYKPTIDFQAAVYALMRESWRARVCPICRRFIIASKPANIYCSRDCAIAARQKRDLDYWRSEGRTLRLKRTKAARKKSGKKK
jgi:hypothetical protein